MAIFCFNNPTYLFSAHQKPLHFQAIKAIDDACDIVYHCHYYSNIFLLLLLLLLLLIVIVTVMFWQCAQPGPFKSKMGQRTLYQWHGKGNAYSCPTIEKVAIDPSPLGPICSGNVGS